MTCLLPDESIPIEFSKFWANIYVLAAVYRNNSKHNKNIITGRLLLAQSEARAGNLCRLNPNSTESRSENVRED